jgi:hypothetical protein
MKISCSNLPIKMMSVRNLTEAIQNWFNKVLIFLVVFYILLITLHIALQFVKKATTVNYK